MRKRHIEQCAIDYDGKSYAVHISGGDRKGAGGIMDLSKDFTEALLANLDSSILASPYYERGAGRIQKEMYRFLQYHVLGGLQIQLTPQGGSEM
jgi:hypothetical protein